MRLVTLVLATLLGATPALADVTATLRITMSGARKQTMAGTWYQGAKGARIEMETPVGKTVVIADNAAGKAYVLMTATKTYLEQGPGKGAEAELAACAGAGADACLAKRGFRKTGAEAANGFDCDVWERAEAADGERMGIKTWRPKKGALPFARAEYAGAGGQSSRIDVVSVREGPVAASLFQLPAGYTRQELPAMPGFAPGQQGRMPTKAEIDAIMKQFGGANAGKALELPTGGDD